MPPIACRQQELLQVYSANATQCVASGQIADEAVSLPLCWNVSPKANQSVFRAGQFEAKVAGCLPLAGWGEPSYSTRVQHVENGAVVISFYRQAGSASSIRSTLLSLLMALLLVLWIEQPLMSTYYWLDADILVAPLLFNIANIKPDHPTGCEMCQNVLCSWTCSIPISAYIWAITGLALPGAIASTVSRKWPTLRRFVTPHFTHTAIVVNLLAASVAHMPVGEFGENGVALLYYGVGGAMCAVCGAASVGPFASTAEQTLTNTLLVLTAAHTSASMFRVLVQMHPSFDPTDALSVAGGSAFVSSTFLIAGRYGAK